MPRKLTIQILAALMLVGTTSTADACCLPPVLNPFVWLFGCGHGCNSGCGTSQGCGLAPLFCGTGCGYGYGYGGECAPACGGYAPGYGGAAPAYGSMGTSTLYSPSWPSASAGCGCDSAASAIPPQHGFAPAPQATAWAPAPAYGYGNGFNPAMAQQHRPMTAAAWSPNAAWAPAPAPTAWAPVAPTRSAALPTAPIYGPWESAAPPNPRAAAGDITGDHEAPNAYRVPVSPATYQSRARDSRVRPVSYGVRPRPARQYRQSIH